MRLSTKEALLGLSVVFLATVLTTVLPGALCLRLLAGPWQELKQGYQSGYERSAKQPKPQATPPRPRPAIDPNRAIPGVMSLAAYKLQRPPEPTSIRCKYKMEHTNYEEWYKIDAVDFKGQIDSIRSCGVRRDSPTGIRLYEILKDGMEHEMTLKLRYFDWQEKPKLNFLNLEAEITEIVSER